jgi:phage-related protein
MAELGTVFVDIEGDWNKFGKSAESGMVGVAKKAAAAFAGAFVIKQAFDFGKASVDAASDLNESVNAVQKSFNSVDSQRIDELGKKAAESYGLSQSAFNAFAVQFGGFAGQIAGPLGSSSQVVDELTTRIADFASVQNVEVGEAAQIFQSALAGESEAMRRYGIDVSDAAIKQFAMANGIGDGSGELTEQEKVLARHGTIMQQTNKWAGDFADTSDELANSQRIAKASFQDVQAELGAALLPVLGEVMNVVRDDLIPVVGQLSPVFGLVAEAIAALLPSVADLLGMLIPLVVDLLTPLVPIITEVATMFVELATPIIELLGKALQPLLAIAGKLVGMLLDALMPVIEALAPAFDALWPIIELVFIILEPLLPLIELLATVIGGVLSTAISLWVKYLRVLFDIIGPVITSVADFADELTSGLGEVIPGIVEWFEDLPGLIIGFVSDAAEWLLDTGRNVIEGFIRGIKNAASGIVSTIKRFVTDKIPSFVKDALGIGSPSRVMAGLGREIPRGLALGITKESALVDDAMSALVTTPQFGLDSFGAAASTTMSPLSMTFNAPVGGDLGVFSQQVMDAAAREQRYANG